MLHEKVRTEGMVTSLLKPQGEERLQDFWWPSITNQEVDGETMHHLEAPRQPWHFKSEKKVKGVWTMDQRLTLRRTEQQSGGLTDIQFDNDPRRSDRSRNWFDDLEHRLIGCGMGPKKGRRRCQDCHLCIEGVSEVSRFFGNTQSCRFGESAT